MLDDVAHLMMFDYAKIRIAHLMPGYAKNFRHAHLMMFGYAKIRIAHLMPGYAKILVVFMCNFKEPKRLSLFF
jgi:hypothetical protein